MSALRPYVFVDVALDRVSRGDRLTLDVAARRHLLTTLRLADGDEVELADGRGNRARGLIDGDAAVVAGPLVVEEDERPRIEVLQAVPKGRKIDDIVRVLTELGVDAVTLVAARRGVARLETDKAARTLERLAAVARAAAQQSRRARLPAISGPLPVDELPITATTRVLVAHPTDATDLRPAHPVGTIGSSHADTVTVAIGPEGGWDAVELDAFDALGGERIRLGDAVLRTEHAAAAAVAAVCVAVGRW